MAEPATRYPCLLTLCLTFLFLQWPSPAAHAALTGPNSYPRVASGARFDAVQQLHARAPDRVFHYGAAASQYAELWLPATLASRTPVVVFIHGGCWLNAYAIDHSHALATALAQAGFAVWNVEYRRVGDAGGGWPGSLQDIQAALRLLAGIQPEGVDLDRVVLSGHSAGGHLALLAASPRHGGWPAGLGQRGVIGLAAITDIAAYAGEEGSCPAAAVRFMGATPEGSTREAYYDQANPATSPPQGNTLLLQGGADAIVPVAQARALDAPMILLEDAGHFDWIHPGTPAWRTFLQQLQMRLL